MVGFMWPKYANGQDQSWPLHSGTESEVSGLERRCDRKSCLNSKIQATQNSSLTNSIHCYPFSPVNITHFNGLS